MPEITIHRVTLDAPARSGSADAALRGILEARLGTGWQIVRDERGKPRLAGGELAFSVAHSGRIALIAVGPGGLEIGVDVEEHRGSLDRVAIAKRFFSEVEAAAVAARPAEFWRLWCRKEAWLKARGDGLAGLRLAEALDGFVADVDVGEGYSAAVACSEQVSIAEVDFFGG